MVNKGVGGRAPDKVDLHYALTPAQLKSRRLRNIAIALTVGVLVLVFYVMTIAKLGAGFMTRPI